MQEYIFLLLIRIILQKILKCSAKKPIHILVLHIRYKFANAFWEDMCVVCTHFQMPLFNILPCVLVVWYFTWSEML